MPKDAGPLKSLLNNKKGACSVCGDEDCKLPSGQFVCDSCTTCFEQSLQSERVECIADGMCPLRPQKPMCEACRLEKCIAIGMGKAAKQSPDPENNSSRLLLRKRRSEASRQKEGNFDENTELKKARTAEEGFENSEIYYPLSKCPQLIPTKWTRLNTEMGTDSADQTAETSDYIDQLVFWAESSGEETLIPSRSAENFRSLVARHIRCTDLFTCAAHILQENYFQLLENARKVPGFCRLYEDGQAAVIRNANIYIHILDFLFAISQNYLDTSYKLPNGEMHFLAEIAMFGDKKLALELLNLVDLLQELKIVETDYRAMRTMLLCDKDHFVSNLLSSMHNKAAFLWRRSERNKYKLKMLHELMGNIKNEIGDKTKKFLGASDRYPIFEEATKTKCFLPELICTKITKL